MKRRELPVVGGDPMDTYSEIFEQEELVTASGLVVGGVYRKRLRADPNKPERTLGVFWDSRVCPVPGFKVEYGYLVRFDKPAEREGAPAGEHYHERKSELFVAAMGRFLVVLEDRDTKEQVRLEIASYANGSGTPTETIVHVPVGVAHAVKPLTDGESALLVLADYPGSHHDEFPYEMHV